MSLESSFSCGSLRCGFSGGRVVAPGAVGREDPAGVGEQGIGTLGFPRNVGDPVVSKGKPGGRYRVNNSRPNVAALGHAGAKVECDLGTGRTKETKRGGKGDRKSEPLTVPRKRGNRPDGTPWREGEAGVRN